MSSKEGTAPILTTPRNAHPPAARCFSIRAAEVEIQGGAANAFATEAQPDRQERTLHTKL